MKILHVNYSDTVGGAAIGANRLHRALMKNSVNSEMLVIERSSNEQNIYGPEKSLEQLISSSKKIFSRFIKRKLIKTDNKETFSFNYFKTNIVDKIKNLNPDVVHIHWIGNEMISISQLKKIKKPILWTFWDMWPFCGAEHHSNDHRYIDGYTKNNRPNNEEGFDVNRFIWNYKRKHFDFEFTINAPSKWLTNEIKKSFLFKNKKLINIPPNLDINFWHQEDKDFSKKVYSLDSQKKFLLFGSATATNHRKGFDFLVKLFDQKKFSNTKLLIFGERPKNLEKLKIDHMYVGRVTNNLALKLLYSCADLLLLPSKIEIFGQLGLEAQACGLPCVTFEKTGPVDYVKHKTTGYVSKYLDIDDFANGINWILDDSRYSELSKKGIEFVKQNFNDEIIAQKFIKEYEALLS